MNSYNKKYHFEWMQFCLQCWLRSEEFIEFIIRTGQCGHLINVCRDTAEMCSQSIKFEAQSSPFFTRLCEVTSGVCDYCVDQVSLCGVDSGEAKALISACRLLSASCMKVANSGEKDPSFTKEKNQ